MDIYKYNEQVRTVDSTVVVKDDPTYDLLKRSVDIAGAVMMIIFLLPLLVLIGVLIKASDPEGSIFYTQERIGKNFQPFKIYKFRSMYSDADKQLEELLKYNEIDGAMFKMKKDPRVTTIGKYLRMFSLDELPQLINVLKGDMSLVGPRPPLEREVREYDSYDKQRLLVTPGITGLWQVSGRNGLSFKEMVALDLEYIQHACLLNDIKILLKTVVVVLTKDNAY